MAKSLRSTSRKSNRSKLRSKVFGPVENARMHRLSTKLQQVSIESKLEVDEAPRAEARPRREEQSSTEKSTGAQEEDMEVDGDIAKPREKATSSSSRSKASRNTRTSRAGATTIFHNRRTNKVKLKARKG